MNAALFRRLVWKEYRVLRGGLPAETWERFSGW